MKNIDKNAIPVEETSRMRRLEAENFRLAAEIELLQAKLAETAAHLERIQTEASNAFRAAEASRQAMSNTLQEARAQSMIAEAALRAKSDEVARLRELNQRLVGHGTPTRATESAAVVASAQEYVSATAARRAEEALQRGREKFLRDQAPETGADSAAAGASPGEAGAVSGTSLGASAGEEIAGA